MTMGRGSPRNSATRPFIAAGGWLFARWIAPRAKVSREASSHMNSLLHDTITGIRQIKSYTAEDTKQEDFDNASHSLRHAQHQVFMISTPNIPTG